MKKNALLGILSILLISCTKNHVPKIQDVPVEVKVVGAMRNVMWNGKLEGIISMDSLANKSGIYGLGPESYLTGELLLLDGKSFVARATSDTTALVEKDTQVQAPFFVYTTVNTWQKSPLPDSVKSIKELEDFLSNTTNSWTKPFPFKLVGTVREAMFHVQNLPMGTSVSNPTEAHQGQVDYQINDELVEIIGFYSREHQGIFTHHDSYLHMHLITQNQNAMGHLDSASFGSMFLYLPID